MKTTLSPESQHDSAGSRGYPKPHIFCVFEVPNLSAPGFAIFHDIYWFGASLSTSFLRPFAMRNFNETVVPTFSELLPDPPSQSEVDLGRPDPIGGTLRRLLKQTSWVALQCTNVQFIAQMCCAYACIAHNDWSLYVIWHACCRQCKHCLSALRGKVSQGRPQASSTAWRSEGQTLNEK